jgi:hypothetical protein
MLEAPAPIACEALFDGLRDERFDVRFACGRALARLHTRHPEFAIAPQRVFEAVCREAKRTTSLPEAARLVDDAPDETEALLGAAVKDRAHRVLEHCFTLLLAVTEADPIRVAWQALQTNDPALRGTALEYLEHALPEDVRAALWPHLEDTRPRRGARPADAALADLLAAHPSIEIRLSELRERRPER